MSFFGVTLFRSAIGMPKRTRRTLEALGLRRRGQTVFKPVTARTAGMIFLVKELVRVTREEEAKTKAQMKAERRPDPGYYIEKAVPR